MKTLKLFFKSLVNNNACIDGGRKKPWYLAIIMFFLSIATALVPIMSLSLKEKAHVNFESTTYGCREAFEAFSEELNKPEYAESMYVIKGVEKKDRVLINGAFTEYDHENVTLGRVDFKFVYDETIDNAKYTIMKNEKVSVVYFSKDIVNIYIVNQVDREPVVEMKCQKAYKYFDEGYKFSSTYKLSEHGLTATINKTWDVWNDNIDKFYNSTRLRSTWLKVGLFGVIDAAIALIMGFMIWILTRGKKNAYSSMINFWQSFKITAWTMVFPALLSLGFGFLFKNFASALFPLMLGIRAMWLSMKSLRPDGTGYQD